MTAHTGVVVLASTVPAKKALAQVKTILRKLIVCLAEWGSGPENPLALTFSKVQARIWHIVVGGFAVAYSPALFSQGQNFKSL